MDVRRCIFGCFFADLFNLSILGRFLTLLSPPLFVTSEKWWLKQGKEALKSDHVRTSGLFGWPADVGTCAHLITFERLLTFRNDQVRTGAHIGRPPKKFTCAHRITFERLLTLL